MATVDIDELHSQAPPAKRARLHNESSSGELPATMNDPDHTYGTDEGSAGEPSVAEATVSRHPTTEATSLTQSMIPGLGRLGNAPTSPGKTGESLLQPMVAEAMKEAITNPPVPEELNVEMSGTENTIMLPEQALEVQQSVDGEDIKEQVVQPPAPMSTQGPNAEMSGMENATAISALQHAEEMDVEVNHFSKPAVVAEPAPEMEGLNNVESQPITHALEALLGGLDAPASKAPELGNVPVSKVPAANENAEWEVDSSPYESSSDDSSSDDSSEDDSDEGGIIRSDDEGGAAKTKGAGGQLRTKNEVPEEVIPKPDVVITPEMRIEELGVVETIVDNIILIKAKTSGEYRALESSSVLCLADRRVFGVVSETLGRVQQPLYTVRFTNGGEITEAGLSIGTKVFYSEQHAKFALTQALKAYKGSDASNLHDEEVGDEEIEFSDDEAEAEHKKRLKQKKLAKRGGKMPYDGNGRAGPHGHPLQQQHLPTKDGSLSYDDAEDDGPYKPLARPTGFADTVGRSEAPQEGDYVSGMPNRGRGDFRGRGRGDRGRGRGDRGRGRGGFQDRRDNNGFSQTPQGHQQHSPASSQTFSPYSPGTTFSQSPAVTPNTNNIYSPQSQGQYSPQQPMWPQFPQQPFQQQFQGYQNMQSGWPNMPPPPPLPSGAFINPAFFAGNGNQQAPPNQWQQKQQSGRGRGSS
ncbi:Nuclear assembly factor 1 [Hyphodiscus hymeniophilus]|uniref:H/ACA ribonucleoprotein complex non-core subunit NAF1 n=1 Tax=Hyphodiscus hymeniophilus TaxID=353542 RepID=A0A9P6VJX7_9HELO|nr:Nuclear assembly factor 1 [Hyphodiscus hymeniophilus]